MDDLRTAALVAATNAWWAGRISPDEVVTAVGEGRTIELPSAAPLLLGLSRLRESGATALLLALPRPGEPANLHGDPDTISGAILAGSVAVAVGESPVALVPTATGWQVRSGEVPAWGDTAGARRDLVSAVVAASDEITDLQLGRDRPGITGAVDCGLLAMAPLVRLLDPRAGDLALRAARVLLILEIARADRSAALTAREMQSESRILGLTSELESAARAALAAAVNDGARALVSGR